tara:strand:+ start:1085 stop:1846 length:762 start_codon:yes stop_codon:yes gene_type:complete
MFFSSKLKKFKNLNHCFFSRNNGVSKGLYESLNCGLGSNDNKEDVMKNLNLVSKKIGCNKEFLITLNQKHSNKVVYFESLKDVKNKLEGDAIVSKVKNIGIGVLAADCAPILFYDPEEKIIACAHAGWKGALNGIIENTIKKLTGLNCKKENIIAVVGPCIKNENYEVRTDFLKKFTSVNKLNEKFFKKIGEEKYLFDLRGFVNYEISNLNVNNIENIEMDTFSEANLFYSYRRSRVNNEKDYGRCISVILMT